MDEIQNIPDWEKWIKSTYDREQHIKIVISGSNASLLSSDLSTLLTGRHLTSRMFPFSFAEFLEAHEVKLDLKNLPYSKKISKSKSDSMNTLKKAVFLKSYSIHQ